MNSHQGHRARKRFGQNFLHDQNVIQRIINALRPKAGERIIEIGPGLGALTGPLIEAAGRLDVVEIDRDLVERLQQRYPSDILQIHSGDALKFDFCALAGQDNKLRIIGNLPYNISTPLLFHLMNQLDCIQDIHCMLQKEVVERMAAQPGDSDYGRLSIMLQYHCEVVKLFNVSPGAFTPPPKVESAIARLTPHKIKPVLVDNEQRFAQLVNQAFSQRRKTLRNCLKNYLSAEQIEAAGVDPGARPETLSLEEFARLSNSASIAD
jgi:16S rRNA (adenine1518-N6/adenine1519-N6)-dimethyltransferase